MDMVGQTVFTNKGEEVSQGSKCLKLSKTNSKHFLYDVFIDNHLR